MLFFLLLFLLSSSTVSIYSLHLLLTLFLAISCTLLLRALRCFSSALIMYSIHLFTLCFSFLSLSFFLSFFLSAGISSSVTNSRARRNELRSTVCHFHNHFGISSAVQQNTRVRTNRLKGKEDCREDKDPPHKSHLAFSFHFFLSLFLSSAMLNGCIIRLSCATAWKRWTSTSFLIRYEAIVVVI